MRIAHVTATFPPYYGGTGTVCYHNALGLARLGHEVTVLTAGGHGVEGDDPPGVTVRRLRPLFRAGNAPCLPGLLRLQGFDVVHLHYPFYFGAEAVLLRSVLSAQPYVVTYHQDVLLGGWLRGPERLHHRVVGRSILRRARKVLATSWDYARASRLGEFVQRYPEKAGELPNGVDVERFQPGLDGDWLRGRYDLPNDARVVLLVGALDRAHYFKGLPVLLEALRRMDDAMVRLLVVGDGDLRDRYEEQAALQGPQGQAIFAGRVPDADLAAHYALCDLLVLPSTTMGEAFGLVLLEAMACGKPVVASRLPGVRSVVSDGEDGLLVQPGDAGDLADKIGALLRDPERRRGMGEWGRAKVEERYAWPMIIPRLVQVYEEALADEAACA